mmetsp:Transcript_3833/g.14235  ORF Transcript_3833/g.14235 Transcript_3833/m.14235 type:complete len:213 (+) Transcript_3833:3868-4506(+)
MKSCTTSLNTSMEMASLFDFFSVMKNMRLITESGRRTFVPVPCVMSSAILAHSSTNSCSSRMPSPFSSLSRKKRRTFVWLASRAVTHIETNTVMKSATSIHDLANSPIGASMSLIRRRAWRPRKIDCSLRAAFCSRSPPSKSMIAAAADAAATATGVRSSVVTFAPTLFPAATPAAVAFSHVTLYMSKSTGSGAMRLYSSTVATDASFATSL